MGRDQDDPPDTAGTADVLRALWSAKPEDGEQLAETLPEAKACRNMKNISFDGMADPGSDLREAWRERLAREGKLSTSGDSIRDLVLGADTPR
jgi:hypothetical protein